MSRVESSLDDYYNSTNEECGCDSCRLSRYEEQWSYSKEEENTSGNGNRCSCDNCRTRRRRRHRRRCRPETDTKTMWVLDERKRPVLRTIRAPPRSLSSHLHSKINTDHTKRVSLDKVCVRALLPYGRQEASAFNVSPFLLRKLHKNERVAKESGREPEEVWLSLGRTIRWRDAAKPQPSTLLDFKGGGSFQVRSLENGATEEDIDEYVRPFMQHGACETHLGVLVYRNSSTICWKRRFSFD